MPSSVLETLQWIKGQGGKPLTVRFRGKDAHKDWQDPNYSPSVADFSGQTNIGMRLGPGAFGGDIYDVDVDCKEALFYAAHLLPPTEAIFGRAGNPKSHYLYRIINFAQENKGQISDPTIKEGKRSIIDIRGRGAQTVMPGSVHETGEPIEWERDPYPNIPMIEEEDLVRAVRKVGMCVLLERHIWLPGMRHFANLSVTGMLWNMKFSLEEVEQMVGLVMERHGDEDASRIPTLRGTWDKAENGQRVTGATRLRREFPDAGPCVDLFMKWFGSEIHGVIEDYNEKFAVLRYGGDIKIAIFNRDKSFDLMNEGAFHKLYMTDTITVKDDDGKEKKLPKSRLWFNSPSRVQYDGVVFMPGVPNGHRDLDGYMNLWTGWGKGCEPAECNFNEAFKGCREWLKLLRDDICQGDEALFHWCRDWFASIVREPMTKPGTSLTIRGPQGSGKSTLFGYFGKILGRGYVPVNSERAVAGNFNAHLEQCLLLHSEEAFYARSKQSQSVIKNLITDQRIQIERKGHDTMTIDNYSRIGATSNQLHVIHAEHDDRRNTFIDMKNHVPPQSVFDAVYTEMNDGGPSYLHKYLREYEGYEPLRLRKPHQTTEATLQKVLSGDPIVQWWEGRLQQGTMLNAPYGWCARPAFAHWPKYVSKQALYCSFSKWARDNHKTYVDGDVEFIIKLTKLMDNHPALNQRGRIRVKVPDNWDERSRGIGDDLGERQYSWDDFPDIQTSRDCFLNYMGVSRYDWNPLDHDRYDIGHEDSNPPAETPNF